MRSQSNNIIASSAEMLVRFGTPTDRTAALVALAAIARSTDEEVSGLAALYLNRLGELANSPDVIASLESILAQQRHSGIGHAINAWTAIVTQRGTRVDVVPLRAVIADQESDGWIAAAGVVLKHGGADDRAEVREIIAARTTASDADTALRLIEFLLRNDPEPDRPALILRIEQIVADEGLINLTVPASVARLLGEMAWTAPKLIARLTTFACGRNDIAAFSLEVLAELARLRPPGASIACPSVIKMARHAIAVASASEAKSYSWSFVSALRALSTFPELSTQVKAVAECEGTVAATD